MRYATEEGARSMGHGMRARIWGCALVLCVLVGVSFVGCPAPEPTQETTAHDGNTIWRGETTAPDEQSDQSTNDLEPPALISITPITINKSVPLNAAAFVDDNGVAVGTELFSSTTAGASWKKVSPGVWQGTMYDVAISPNKKKILAVGGVAAAPQNGLLLLSEDSGASWRVVSLLKSEGDDLRFRAVVWLSDLQALAAGQAGLLYRTRDGGENWEKLDSLPENSKGLTWYDLTYVDGIVWMVGEKGTILRSDTNGTSWESKRQGPSDGAFRSIHFIDLTTGITVGEKGLAAITRNAGRDWTKLGGITVFPDDENLNTVISNGTNVFVILADRTFWVSKNRGSFWRSNGIFLSELPAKHAMTGAAFYSADTLFITSTYGVVLKGILQ